MKKYLVLFFLLPFAASTACAGSNVSRVGSSIVGDVDLTQDVENELPIANGGTGETTAAEGITALSTPAGASDDTKVLTYVHSAGLVRLESAPASYITDSGTNASLTATGDDFAIGAAAAINSAKLSVLATDDQIPLNIKGSSGGGSDLLNARTNDGTIVAKIDADGDIIAKSFSTTSTSLSDDTFAGFTITLTAGENVSLGHVCYMKSDGKVWKADADALSTMPALFIATATIAADATGVFGTQGYLRDDSAYNFTIGARQYVSTTAGDITATAPTGQDDVIQKIGIGLTADILYFVGSITEVEDSTT